MDEKQKEFELATRRFYDWVERHSDMYYEDEEGYITLSDDAPEEMKEYAKRKNDANKYVLNILKTKKENGELNKGKIKVYF